MTERTITALFTDDVEARRAAEAVRALGFSDDRVALIARSALGSGHLGAGADASGARPLPAGASPSGLLLVVRAGVEDEGKLVGVLEHHRPDQITSEAAEHHAAGWTRFDEAAGSFGAVEISDDRLGTRPAVPPERDAAPPRTRPADAAPEPGSAGGGEQARLERMQRSVLGTPDPALDRAPEPAPNTPAGERRAQGGQTRAERDSERQNR